MLDDKRAVPGSIKLNICEATANESLSTLFRWRCAVSKWRVKGGTVTHELHKDVMVMEGLCSPLVCFGKLARGGI